jgi:hypothetical protein
MPKRDGVDGAVEGPVATAVKPVADSAAAAGRDRAGATQRGKRGLTAAPGGLEELTMPWAALTGPMP